METQPVTQTTFSLSNFGKQNTPDIPHKIGNVCLIIAAVGGGIALAPVSTPIIATIGVWSAFAGTLGKILTNLSGETEIK